MNNLKTYQELIALPTFMDRFNYLKIGGAIGKETFGNNRWVNQRFYQSREWKRVRDLVIVRDNGCDLGIPGLEIPGRILVHHINPITVDDISDSTIMILNPDNLITVSYDTHNAIHFGDSALLPKDPIERKPNDTCPWLQ